MLILGRPSSQSVLVLKRGQYLKPYFFERRHEAQDLFAMPKLMLVCFAHMCSILSDIFF